MKKVTKAQIKEVYESIISNNRLRSKISYKIKSLNYKHFENQILKAVAILNDKKEYRTNNIIFASYLFHGDSLTNVSCTCLVVNRNSGISLKSKYGAYKHSYVY